MIPYQKFVVVLKEYEEIKVLGDLPMKLQSLLTGHDGKIYQLSIQSPALGKSAVTFCEKLSTSFMHNHTVYTLNIEPLEFQRIRIFIDRKQ